MKLEKFRYDDIVILKFTGEFDTFNLPAFSERIDRMISLGDTKLVLDLHLLTFINSAALGYLIKTHKTLAQQGGEMVLARPSKFLRKTLVTLGLDSMFKIFETAEAGVAHFKRGTDAGQIKLEQPEHDDSGLTGQVPILFRPISAAGDTAMPNQVGRIVNLHKDALDFRCDPPQGAKDAGSGLDQIKQGARLKLKFRQPFVIKDHYFEMEGVVLEVKRSFSLEESSSTGMMQVKVRYDKVKDEDRMHLEQFWRDQDEWKAEIRK